MPALPMIEVLVALSADDAVALERLLPQLSASATFDIERMSAVVRHDSTTVLVARIDGTIAGMLTLVAILLPTGARGHIEDVVVDELARGQGVARMLLDFALMLTRERGLRTVDLTSRPTRVAAQRLYESVGFRRRETDNFRYTL